MGIGAKNLYLVWYARDYSARLSFPEGFARNVNRNLVPEIPPMEDWGDVEAYWALIRALRSRFPYL